MVHADPADFDDVATFCTMRLFERAENPERYWFPVDEFFDRTDFGTQDDYEQVVRGYATEKLSLSTEKAEQFRSQFSLSLIGYFHVGREQCRYNLVRFMAILGQIWEEKTVEALGDILDHFRDKANHESLMVEIASAFGRQQRGRGSDPRAILVSANNDLANLVRLEMMVQSVGDGDVKHSARELQGAMSASRLSLQMNSKKLKEFSRKEICQSTGLPLSEFHVLMDEVNQNAFAFDPFDIRADATEFVVMRIENAAAIQQIRMYPDDFATQCNVELIATFCLQCAVAAALNEESGKLMIGIDPPSCVMEKSFAKLVSGPATPEYQRGKCATCLHAETVHYNSVKVLGCGTCYACLRHSAELWDLIDQVARLEIPASVKYPSNAFRLPDDPPAKNKTWTTMPLLNRKMIIAQALRPVGSALYPHLCDELLSALHLAPAQLTTAQDALAMDSRPNILHGEVDDSSTIDAPVPRLFIRLIQNGYFAKAFHVIQSRYEEMMNSDTTTEQFAAVRTWLNFVKLYFSDQRASFTSVEPVPSVSNIKISDTVAYSHFLIRAEQTRIYAVDRSVSAVIVKKILEFVQFTDQPTGANHVAAVTPELDLRLASIDFSIIQGAEALSIVKFRKGHKLGEGKFGKVYQVTCGSMRMALKVIDLKKCSISQYEAVYASASAHTVSSWIDLLDDKMYILMPRFTTNLCDYIETKKGLISSGNDICKVAAYRVIVASVGFKLLSALFGCHDGEPKVYHGDIHAGNVFLLLDEDGPISDVALGDFGLAHSGEKAPTETATTDQSCPNPSGTPVFSGFSSTGEGYDLSNLRSNVIRYMLKDIKKHLSVEELRLCDWQTRGPSIVFTAEEMQKAADEALGRTLLELSLITVFLPPEDTQVLLVYLPHFVRPDFDGLRKKLCEMFPSHMRTAFAWDQVKVCLEAATRKQVDRDNLLKSVDEIRKSSLSQQLCDLQDHMQQLVTLSKSLEDVPTAQPELSLSQQLSDIQDHILQQLLTLSRSVEEVLEPLRKLSLNQRSRRLSEPPTAKPHPSSNKRRLSL